MCYMEKNLSKSQKHIPLSRRMVDSFHIFKPVIINSSIGYKSLYERVLKFIFLEAEYKSVSKFHIHSLKILGYGG